MNILKVSILLFTILFIGSCTETKVEELKYIPTEIDIIPRPIIMEVADGFFEINSNTKIIGNSEMMNSINILRAYLSKGLKENIGDNGVGNTIIFLTDDELNNDEAYRIEVGKDVLSIKASSDKGAFYAIQTLRQIIPAEMENSTCKTNSLEVPYYKIYDSPRYEYRGFMLDVARHFYTVAEVKRVIDLLTIYKINTLHMHLTDDQGWRIEIKSWPALTLYGSTSSVNSERHGFYTQDEFLEIQAYALKHHIELIPEIDMPGHTNAALASYPILNCNGEAPELYTGVEVGFSSLCVAKDTTYAFINDVLREIAAITTGRYIHIGGDESHSTATADYITFINRVRKMVRDNGKEPIGWDEIANAEIEEGAIVQYWGDVKNAQLAAKKKARIIMSPADRIYLDIKYNDSTKLGLKWAGFNDVKDAYDWKVDNLVEGVYGDMIMGIEAPLWTETITSVDDIEYMMFPRIIGVAEIAWSDGGGRNWENYKVRLAKQKLRLEKLGVNFYKSDLVEWK